jgi:hypothetical protein
MKLEGVADFEGHEEGFAFDVCEGEVYTSWVSGMRVSVLNDVRDIRKSINQPFCKHTDSRMIVLLLTTHVFEVGRNLPLFLCNPASFSKPDH